MQGNLTNRQTGNLTGYPSIDKPWLKYYSEEAIKAKPYSGSVFNHIYEKNEKYLDNYALKFFGNRITYRSLFENVELVANALTEKGIKKGDNVILLMSSCPELVYLLLSINRLGAIDNMISPLFTKEQIRDRINDTNAELMFVLDRLYGLVKDSKTDLCIKQTVVVPISRSMPPVVRMIAEMKMREKILYGAEVIKWSSFVKKKESYKVIDVNDNELPAIMVYSSGTTGASKGIVLLNCGINATISHYEYTGFKYDRSWTYLQIIPTWFSTGAVFCLLMPLCLGLCVVLEPVFNEENFTKDIKKYKPNMIMGATSQWLHFLNNIKSGREDLSFIKYPITGGEKLLSKTEIELNEILNKCGCSEHMVTGYGMCELGSTATATSMDHYKYGSSGYPIKGVTVSAFDIFTNKPCRYYERGEIRVLTPARMKGYYNRPDATNEFFWKDSEKKEWGCTGDIGYIDEDGFVFVEGRASDSFTSLSGDTVYNFDIENVILKSKSVFGCEVVGRKNVHGYEEAFCFVVLNQGCNKDASLKEIRQICEKELDSEHIPVEYVVLDSFPVKVSGKRDMERLYNLASEYK